MSSEIRNIFSEECSSVVIKKNVSGPWSVGKFSPWYPGKGYRFSSTQELGSILFSTDFTCSSLATVPNDSSIILKIEVNIDWKLENIAFFKITTIIIKEFIFYNLKYLKSMGKT